ncbi:ABC transporter permease [Rubellimicrobium roseum]|uniref:Autoinducer 2 import system permease protein LsrD n=1 Tax=Rubellimicrobium roseum TaxID=687525 RepID=A0A5C4NK09_9RHOB|nr:ABC transporter permease [Rubellimicrobium roseum]TNC72739.1 ABC transporter permease [Rubellimicrobium roseum]
MADTIRKISFIRSTRLEQESLTFGVVVLLAVVLSFVSPAFLDPNNLASLQTALAPNLIVAIGMMTLFMIGRFDLSVGAVMGISGIASAMALNAGLPVPVAFLAGIATGVFIGAFNGFMVARLGINHLIVTLGVLYMTRGVIEVAMSGEKLAGFTSFPPSFSLIGQLQFAGVSALFLFALLLCVVFESFLRLTLPGRKLLFLGGNPQAAEATGIRRRWTEFWCFVLSGGLAALAGVLMTARVGMANRYMGEGLEMQIFIACLIGGGSIAGGKGSYVGALAGVLFVTLLTNAFNLLSVPSEWQAVVIGAVLVLVVVVDGVMVLRKSGRPWNGIFGLFPNRISA